MKKKFKISSSITPASGQGFDCEYISIIFQFWSMMKGWRYEEDIVTCHTFMCLEGQVSTNLQLNSVSDCSEEQSMSLTWKNVIIATCSTFQQHLYLNSNLSHLPPHLSQKPKPLPKNSNNSLKNTTPCSYSCNLRESQSLWSLELPKARSV